MGDANYDQLIGLFVGSTSLSLQYLINKWLENVTIDIIYKA